MANRFVLPLETLVDATGAPYAGAQLFFYASGTSTKLDTFSDPDLAPAHANTNPVILDSAGRFPNAIFLQNLQYSVVLAPSTDTDPPTSPIWTQDPVYTSDYSAQAKFKSGSGSPNGTVAGTAGSATVSADAYWDYANDILYICTTTGTASTAVWTAINASTAAAVVTPPQGYLTLTSGVPIIPGDVTAATTIYYTPYIGVLVPIYNGSSFVPISIVSELQYTLTSSLSANNIYDCFIFLNGGVATLGTGPSWSAGTGGSITAGSCARGTGTGGSAISQINGIYTNTVSMTIRYGNGTTTATVAPNQATYVGSIFMDGTNGQVSCYRSYGQSRKWGVWNAFNRMPVCLKVGDSTASWNYTSGTIRPSNNSTANSLTTFSGLAEDIYDFNFWQNVTVTAGGTGDAFRIGIGYNSTTAFSGFSTLSSTTTTTIQGVASYQTVPALGINVITALEAGAAGGSGVGFDGTELNMILAGRWMA
ncbi:MAG: hypothetical protein KGL39_30870 [Patescibacteria group bacterium]|nr:hypothetical protein [Patescibacteria group bacterium]